MNNNSNDYNYDYNNSNNTATNTNSNDSLDDKFVLIPKEIIQMNKLFSMRMIIFVYLAMRRSLLDDNAYISLNDLLSFSNCIPNRHKSGTNNKVIETLNSLESINYFKKTNGDYCGSNLTVLKINKDKFDVPNFFVCILLSEIYKMQKYKSKGQSRSASFSNLLLVLSYIRFNKLKRTVYQESNPEKKPEFFYRLIKSIALDIGLSERTVSKCISVLNDLDIIVSRPMPRYQDKSGNWHTGITLFVDKTVGWEDELKWGEEFLLENKSLYVGDSQYEVLNTS